MYRTLVALHINTCDACFVPLLVRGSHSRTNDGGCQHAPALAVPLPSDYRPPRYSTLATGLELSLLLSVAEGANIAAAFVYHVTMPEAVFSEPRSQVPTYRVYCKGGDGFPCEVVRSCDAQDRDETRTEHLIKQRAPSVGITIAGPAEP